MSSYKERETRAQVLFGFAVALVVCLAIGKLIALALAHPASSWLPLP